MRFNYDFNNLLATELYKLNDAEAIGLFFAYLKHRSYLNNIISRIKLNFNTYIENGKKILKSRKKPDRSLFRERLNIIDSLSLDIESLHIFLRVYLDVICRIIKRIKKINLPNSMNKLLFSTNFQKYSSNDTKFFLKLKEELKWGEAIIADRNNLVHNLHNVVLLDYGKDSGLHIGFHFRQKNPIKEHKKIARFIKNVEIKITHLENFLIKNMN